MASRYIKLIVTKGCASCNTQRDLLKKAIEQSKNREISVDVVDISELPKKEARKLNLLDFPTTLFYLDGGLRFKMMGTYPVPVIIRYIQLYL